VTLELCLITNDPDLAGRADAAGIERVLIDLERLGKAARQAGHGLFLSTHELEDVHAVRRAVAHARVMVRTNPLHSGSEREIDDAVNAGADVLMLPMATGEDEVAAFVELVGGAAEVSVLVETRGAVEALPAIVRVGGVSEIHVGLNDLRLSLGLTSLFDALADGTVDRIAAIAAGAGVRFGFGGVTSPRRSGLPVAPELVIGEHVRLGSRLAWLERSFRDGFGDDRLQDDVDAIRNCANSWTRAGAHALAENRRAFVREVSGAQLPVATSLR
jgi:HpcH/HpaI aldolase/citrate lyase family protein